MYNMRVLVKNACDTRLAQSLEVLKSCNFFFFFQAEDGIRDWSVTGVQTCALPISSTSAGTGKSRSRNSFGRRRRTKVKLRQQARPRRRSNPPLTVSLALRARRDV